MGINAFRKNVYSQNGEDGIIQEINNRLLPLFRRACEFGAPTKEYCSNIYNLTGWELIYLDSDPQEADIIKAFITPENVNELIPDLIDILSIDTDGNDYAIWKAYKNSPAVVVIEINSSLDPSVDFFTTEKGCNFSMMNKLAENKGYFLLAHSGNCIYIKKEYEWLFKDKDQTFDKSWLLH